MRLLNLRIIIFLNIKLNLFVSANNTWNRLTVCKIELLVVDRNTWNHLTVSQQMINTKYNAYQTQAFTKIRLVWFHIFSQLYLTYFIGI